MSISELAGSVLRVVASDCHYIWLAREFRERLGCDTYYACRELESAGLVEWHAPTWNRPGGWAITMAGRAEAGVE